MACVDESVHGIARFQLRRADVPFRVQACIGTTAPARTQNEEIATVDDRLDEADVGVLDSVLDSCGSLSGLLDKAKTLDTLDLLDLPGGLAFGSSSLCTLTEPLRTYTLYEVPGNLCVEFSSPSL